MTRALAAGSARSSRSPDALSSLICQVSSITSGAGPGSSAWRVAKCPRVAISMCSFVDIGRCPARTAKARPVTK